MLLGIDGYSQLITYINCSDNNSAETVLECFLCGGHQYGFPSRVRSDYGLENLHVAYWTSLNFDLPG